MKNVKAWNDIAHDDVAFLHKTVNITSITTKAFGHDSHAINGEIQIFLPHIILLVRWHRLTIYNNVALQR